MFLAFFIGINIGSALCAAECQKAHDTLFALIGKSCIISPDNGTVFHAFSQFLHKNNGPLLSLNNRYYVHYIQPNVEPLTPLAYACYSVTCDYRVVRELCAVGTHPNHTYQYGGLYPATYIFKSLIRLYPTRDEHAHYVKNQIQKLSILNDTVQLDAFVTIDPDTNKSEEDDGVYLAVDRCVIKLITPEIKVWLQQLLNEPVASLNFESQDCVYKLQ